MKSIQLKLMTIVLAFASSFTFAQEMAGAEITFEKEIHDYGKIEKDADGTCFFTFTNTGSTPLLIETAIGSCGCTVPEWPREPIAPGKSAEIEVKYKTNRVGLINKTVTITSNATNAPQSVIRIKGEVLASEGNTAEKPTSAPIQK